MNTGGWAIVYEKAIRDDGSLFFPERLTKAFLDEARRTMGSYLFANQYQNEVIPDDEKKFKQEWLRYYKEIPQRVYTFAFIDPAIGQKKTSDYTGQVVIDVDVNGNWYLKIAKRERLTPTEIVNRVFELHKQFGCRAIGVESVAYQEALLYMIDEEARRRQCIAPVVGVKPATDRTKEMRILSLVPRFEFGRILIAQGLYDFESEYSQFPRSSHDDIIDSLAQLEELVSYPPRETEKPLTKPHHHEDKNYEKYIIQQAERRANGESDDTSWS